MMISVKIRPRTLSAEKLKEQFDMEQVGNVLHTEKQSQNSIQPKELQKERWNYKDEGRIQSNSRSHQVMESLKNSITSFKMSSMAYFYNLQQQNPNGGERKQKVQKRWRKLNTLIDLKQNCADHKDSQYKYKSRFSLRISKSDTITHEIIMLNDIEENDQELIGLAQMDKWKFNENNEELVSHQNIIILQTCSICMQILSESSEFSLENCKHRFCLECVISYLQNKIDIFQVVQITCPQDGCMEQFSEPIINSLLCQNYKDKYERFLFYKQIENDPKKKWCPKIGCLNYIEKMDGSNEGQCHKCGQMICFECGNPQHEGRTCFEALDATYKNAIRKFKIKRCPKCRCDIQKSSGCNHMTCSQCRFQFCWLCMQRYTKYHYRIWNICGCPSCNGQFEADIGCSLTTARVLTFIPKLLILLLFLPYFLIIKLFQASIKSIVKSCKIYQVFKRQLKKRKQNRQKSFQKINYRQNLGCCFYGVCNMSALCFTSIQFWISCPLILVFCKFPKMILKTLEKCFAAS